MYLRFNQRFTGIALEYFTSGQITARQREVKDTLATTRGLSHTQKQRASAANAKMSTTPVRQEQTCEDTNCKPVNRRSERSVTPPSLEWEFGIKNMKE